MENRSAVRSGCPGGGGEGGGGGAFGGGGGGTGGDGVMNTSTVPRNRASEMIARAEAAAVERARVAAEQAQAAARRNAEAARALSITKLAVEAEATMQTLAEAERQARVLMTM